MDTANIVFVLFSSALVFFNDFRTSIFLWRSGKKKKCH